MKGSTKNLMFTGLSVLVSANELVWFFKTPHFLFILTSLMWILIASVSYKRYLLLLVKEREENEQRTGEDNNRLS